MSYTPQWNATFAKPLINQVIALIQRDQAGAIEAVNPALPVISEFHKGPGVRTAFPWLLLTANSTVFQPDSPWMRASKTVINMLLDVGQFDQELAQDTAQDYARMLDMIITSANSGNSSGVSSWETPLPIQHETVPSGITAPPQTGSVKEVFVESHRYSVVTAQEIQSPVLRVVLNVLFAMQET